MSREEHWKWATNALKVKALIIKIIPWRVQEIGVVDLEEKTQVDFLGKKEVKAVLTQSMFKIELKWRVKLKSSLCVCVCVLRCREREIECSKFEECDMIWVWIGEGRKDKGLNQISNTNRIHQWQSLICSAFAMSPTAPWNFVTVHFQVPSSKFHLVCINNKMLND